MVSELPPPEQLRNRLIFAENGPIKRLLGLKNGQNQGFSVTDSSTVRFVMLFIPWVLQEFFE
jgi:hypothetical protein